MSDPGYEAWEAHRAADEARSRENAAVEQLQSLQARLEALQGIDVEEWAIDPIHCDDRCGLPTGRPCYHHFELVQITMPAEDYEDLARLLMLRALPERKHERVPATESSDE